MFLKLTHGLCWINCIFKLDNEFSPLTSFMTLWIFMESVLLYCLLWGYCCRSNAHTLQNYLFFIAKLCFVVKEWNRDQLCVWYWCPDFWEYSNSLHNCISPIIHSEIIKDIEWNISLSFCLSKNNTFITFICTTPVFPSGF